MKQLVLAAIQVFIISMAVADDVPMTAREQGLIDADKFNRYHNEPWFELVADSYHDQWWGYTGANAVAFGGPIRNACNRKGLG